MSMLTMKGEQFRTLGDTREKVDSSIVANATFLIQDLFVEDVKLRLSVISTDIILVMTLSFLLQIY